MASSIHGGSVESSGHQIGNTMVVVLAGPQVPPPLWLLQASCDSVRCYLFNELFLTEVTGHRSPVTAGILPPSRTSANQNPD